MTLDPNRKPMPPEKWGRVRTQVRENVRLIRLGRAKKRSADSAIELVRQARYRLTPLRAPPSPAGNPAPHGSPPKDEVSDTGAPVSAADRTGAAKQSEVRDAPKAIFSDGPLICRLACEAAVACCRALSIMDRIRA